MIRLPTTTDPVEILCADAGGVLRQLPAESVNAVLVDPPYSERTHKGHDSAGGYDGADRKKLGYGAWTQEHVDLYVPEFCRVASGWVVVMTDDVLAGPIGDAMRKCGRYVFAPLPFYSPGSRVRLTGDGPSSWTIWIVVARTKKQVRWGTLPGGYLADGPLWRNSEHMGGKPTKLMRELVKDYTRPGDLVLDCFAGAHTTALACLYEGRRCLSVEMEEKHCETGRKRITKLRSRDCLVPYTPRAAKPETLV